MILIWSCDCSILVRTLGVSTLSTLDLNLATGHTFAQICGPFLRESRGLSWKTKKIKL